MYQRCRFGNNIGDSIAVVMLSAIFINYKSIVTTCRSRHKIVLPPHAFQAPLSVYAVAGAWQLVVCWSFQIPLYDHDTRYTCFVLSFGTIAQDTGHSIRIESFNNGSLIHIFVHCNITAKQQAVIIFSTNFSAKRKVVWRHGVIIPWSIITIYDFISCILWFFAAHPQVNRSGSILSGWLCNSGCEK